MQDLPPGLESKPDVPVDLGAAPPEALVVEDLVEGSGEYVFKGATVTVNYVGVAQDDGAEFDSSWSRNETISFPLSGVIEGWRDGIPGMKVGGRRRLVIPPQLAYGFGGHPLANKTLVFVVDLIDVQNP